MRRTLPRQRQGRQGRWWARHCGVWIHLAVVVSSIVILSSGVVVVGGNVPPKEGVAETQNDVTSTVNVSQEEQESLSTRPLRRLRRRSSFQSDTEEENDVSSTRLDEESDDDEDVEQVEYYEAGGFHVRTQDDHAPLTRTPPDGATLASDPPKFEPVVGTVDFEVPPLVLSLLAAVRPNAPPPAPPQDYKDVLEDFLDDNMSFVVDKSDLGSVPFKPIEPLFPKDEIPINMITLPLSLELMSGYIGGAQPDGAPMESNGVFGPLVPTFGPRGPATREPTTLPPTRSPTLPPAPPPRLCPVVETFSTDARGNPLPAGTLLNKTVTMKYATYAARRAQDDRRPGNPYDDAMIFDCRTWKNQTRDWDLIQDPQQGNVLIIAKRRILTDAFPVPDDNGAGGTISATFAGDDVTMQSMTLLDVDRGGATIRFYGPSRTVLEELFVPPGADGQIRVVPTPLAGVSKFTIRLLGSGALDDVRFQRPSTPELPCPSLSLEMTAASLGGFINPNTVCRRPNDDSSLARISLPVDNAAMTLCLFVTNTGDSFLTNVAVTLQTTGAALPPPPPPPPPLFVLAPGETQLLPVVANPYRHGLAAPSSFLIIASIQGNASTQDGQPIELLLGSKPTDQANVTIAVAASP